MARMIGQTLCETCGGSGKQADERPCSTCGGTGLVLVLETGQIIPQAERRRWPRCEFDVPVRVTRKTGIAGVVIGRGTEVNEGGLTINADAALNVGDELDLELLPPYFGPPLKLRSAIRDAIGHRYGVEFLPTDLAEERQLTAFREFLRTSLRPPG